MAAETSRVVLVTGSSSGIGRASADHLSQNGWHVWGASRRLTAASEVGTWTPVRLDVTSDDSVAAAMAAVLERSQRLDALVHCAGIAVAGSVEDVTLAEAEHQIATNYLGTVRMLRAVLPVMRQQGTGRIIVIGSIGGLIGLPFLGHYSASKFALDGLVEALRHELAPFAIQATILHPGDIRTDISSNQVEGAATGPSSAYHARFRATISAYDRNVREARGPEVIAAAVEHVLTSRRQPARVIAGTSIERAGVGLKSALPRRLFELILRKSYGL
ncbi:MAG: SDR family oxidoreductase [Hyphomicrobiaceae bacterium]|nr:SDR family oxidoreductase [Hyphomicrobiaceae bacterium]